MQNVGFSNEVKNLKEQLTPTANALDILQSDSATIADACHKWCELIINEQAMQAPHFLANILHPKYKGNLMKPEHTGAAQKYLLQKNPDLISVVSRLMICHCQNLFSMNRVWTSKQLFGGSVSENWVQ